MSLISLYSHSDLRNFVCSCLSLSDNVLMFTHIFIIGLKTCNKPFWTFRLIVIPSITFLSATLNLTIFSALYNVSVSFISVTANC